MTHHIHKRFTLFLFCLLLLAFSVCAAAESATQTYTTPYLTMRLPKSNTTFVGKDAVREYDQAYLNGSLTKAFDGQVSLLSFDDDHSLMWLSLGLKMQEPFPEGDFAFGAKDIDNALYEFHTFADQGFSIETWDEGYLQSGQGVIFCANFLTQDPVSKMNWYLAPIQKKDGYYLTMIVCVYTGSISNDIKDDIDQIILNDAFFPGKLAAFNPDPNAVTGWGNVSYAYDEQAVAPQSTRSPASVSPSQDPISTLDYMLLLLPLILVILTFIFCTLWRKYHPGHHPVICRLEAGLFWCLLTAFAINLIQSLLHVRLGALPTVLIGVVCFAISGLFENHLEARDGRRAADASAHKEKDSSSLPAVPSSPISTAPPSEIQEAIEQLEAELRRSKKRGRRCIVIICVLLLALGAETLLHTQAYGNLRQELEQVQATASSDSVFDSAYAQGYDAGYDDGYDAAELSYRLIIKQDYVRKSDAVPTSIPTFTPSPVPTASPAPTPIPTPNNQYTLKYSFAPKLLAYVYQYSSDPEEYLALYDGVWGDLTVSEGDIVFTSLSASQRTLVHFPAFSPNKLYYSPDQKLYHSVPWCYMLLGYDGVTSASLAQLQQYSPCSKCIPMQ